LYVFYPSNVALSFRVLFTRGASPWCHLAPASPGVTMWCLAWPLAPWSPGHAMQLPGNFYFQSFLSSYILIVKFHFEFKSLFSCAIYFRAYIETSFNITKTMLKIMNLTGQKNLFLHLTILTKRHSLPL